jgi:hypothetical protein
MPRELPDPVSTPPAAHLLPGFDEYLLGYKDRGAALESQHAKQITPDGNGRFLPIVVIASRVVGIWRRALKKTNILITIDYFETVNKSRRDAVAAVADNYAQFIGLPAKIANGELQRE